MDTSSLYIHYPFCKSKCPYCDFNSHVEKNIDHDIWQQAYLTEIEYFSDYLSDKNITSIFFGGGTPTLMPPKTAAAIIDKLTKVAKLNKGAEITIEGNPTSIEAQNFKQLQQAGINRISLGIQALNDKDLKFLGREHSSLEALKALEVAKEHFDNYSFDLIYARPGQSIEEWQKELEQALGLTDKHLSLYQLTIEKGTKFFNSQRNNEFTMPDEELSGELFEITNQIMLNNNMPAYEISNYAKAGFESKHNMSYWIYNDYLGIGPGAHSRITLNNNKHSMMMHHMPNKWLESVANNQNGIQNKQELDQQDIISEYILMGLRLTTGINLTDFKSTTSKDFTQDIHPNNLKYLINNKLINIENDRIYIPANAKHLTNSIIEKLLT